MLYLFVICNECVSLAWVFTWIYYLIYQSIEQTTKDHNRSPNLLWTLYKMIIGTNITWICDASHVYYKLACFKAFTSTAGDCIQKIKAQR